MNENKTTWAALKKQVARHAGASEQEVNAFANALIEQLIEGLKNEQSVRINGLGTFRKQAVAPRKSVNVATGEDITIAGYNKLAFTPESGVKELIQSATVLEQEQKTPLQKLSEQADEIVGLLGELGQDPMPQAEAQEQPKQAAAPKKKAAKTKPAVAEPTPEVDEPKVEQPVVEQPVVEQPEHKEELKEEIKEEVKEEVKKEAKKEPKTYHPLRDGLITISIIVVLLIVAYFFLKRSFVAYVNHLYDKIHSEAPAPKQAEAAPAASFEQEAAVMPEKEQVAVAIEEPKEEERVYTEFIDTENLHADSRLAWLAYKYYGEKDCWVFIYEANRDRIANPHQIRQGTPIRIPKLPKQWTDMSNPATRQMVNEMIEMYK